MLRKTKIFLVIALAFIMSITTIPIAHADDEPEILATEAAITKLLLVPHGTTLPNVTFEFEVEAFSFNSVDKNYSYDSDTSTSNMPLINVDAYSTVEENKTIRESGKGIIPISFPEDGSASKYSSVKTVKGTDFYYLESSSLFKDAVFLEAGVYTYNITERDSTYDIEDNNHETLKYSRALYTVKVYVVNNDGNFEIVFIGVTEDIDDNGDAINRIVKVDPTPGGPKDDGSGNTGGNTGNTGSDDPTVGPFSKMMFTNRYFKTNGIYNPDIPYDIDPNTPEEEDFKDLKISTLEISKKIGGAFSSPNKYFSFSLTLSEPELFSDLIKGPYKAFIIDETSTDSGVYTLVAASEASKNGAAAGTNYIEFLLDTSKSFSIKHNQKLVFIDTPVGISYEVTEAGSIGYVPTATISYNGLTNAEISGALNEHLVLNPRIAINEKTFAEYLYVGEADSSVRFHNEADSITPTGLNLNDLPFIGLLALGLGAFIVFVVVKSRKKNRYD